MVGHSRANLSRLLATDALEVQRRTFDLTIACLALVAFGPLMFLIAFAILLESGCPILFSHLRVGQHGKLFRMYKFRKFHKGCGTTGSPLTLQEDARLTKVGKFLRDTKFDELPQFWNVIKGDMSVIGPRPEVIAFVDCFAGRLEKVLDYKPGIIGPSQVLFRNESVLYPKNVNPDGFYRDVLFPTKARIDLDYYQRRTLLWDIKWIVIGILAILGWVPTMRLYPPLTGKNAGDPDAFSCELPIDKVSGDDPPL